MTRAELLLRPATLADAAAISAVHCSTVLAWKDPVTRRTVPYETLDLFGRWYNGGPWMSAELCAIHLNELLLAGQFPLVAEVAGRVVGEAEYLVNREPEPLGAALHLSILYIHREWQGRGVGSALVTAGLALARAHGLPRLTTQPDDDARPFYVRVGFSPWLRFQEVQLATAGAVPLAPAALTPLRMPDTPPADLALRIGRYQCSVLDWETLWPRLALPGWSTLRRWIWRAELASGPAVLGLREQLRDPTQADGYAWLRPDAPLAPAVAALQATAAAQGFQAVDLLLPAESLSALHSRFRLDYQTRLELWHKAVE